MITTTERIKKSIPLTESEQEKLKKYVASFHTKIDAVEHSGINRMTLDRVMYRGSGAPKTIDIIRLLIKSKKTI